MIESKYRIHNASIVVSCMISDIFDYFDISNKLIMLYRTYPSENKQILQCCVEIFGDRIIDATHIINEAHRRIDSKGNAEFIPDASLLTSVRNDDILQFPHELESEMMHTYRCACADRPMVWDSIRIAGKPIWEMCTKFKLRYMPFLPKRRLSI